MHYIKSIYLENIRGFKELFIDFISNDNSSISNKLIIGRNGTCKTTLLRCIAIGLCDEADGNALLPEPFGELIAENKLSALIRIVLLDEDNPKKEVKILTEIIKVEGKEVIGEKERPPNIKIFLCGYGAARCFEGPQPVRGYRIADSVYSLFQYEAVFWPKELVIRRLKDFLGSRFYPKMMRNIKKIIGLDPIKDRIYVEKGGGIFISGPTIGKKIQIEGWADGFLMTFMWILDLFGWALIAKNISSKGEVSGILLIDEIEQHMHPSMEIYVLKLFKEFLPKIQIVATTHSPMVALGSNKNELVVLKRRGKYVYNENEIPDFSKFTADDMISDDKLFSTIRYNPNYQRKLKHYNKLSNTEKNKLSKSNQKKIEELSKDLNRKDYYLQKEDRVLKELEKIKQKYGI